MENSHDIEVELYEEIVGYLNHSIMNVSPSSSHATFRNCGNLARYYPAVRPETTASRLSRRAADGSSDTIHLKSHKICAI